MTNTLILTNAPWSGTTLVGIGSGPMVPRTKKLMVERSEKCPKTSHLRT